MPRICEHDWGFINPPGVERHLGRMVKCWELFLNESKWFPRCFMSWKVFPFDEDFRSISVGCRTRATALPLPAEGGITGHHPIEMVREKWETWNTG